MERERKPFITIREIIIAAFFVGGYVMQFSYMNSQLNQVAAQNALMAHEINILQIQTSAQTIKIEYITEQLNWMRERWG